MLHGAAVLAARLSASLPLLCADTLAHAKPCTFLSHCVRSLARSLVGSLAGSFAGWLARWLVRSLARLLVRLLGVTFCVRVSVNRAVFVCLCLAHSS